MNETHSQKDRQQRPHVLTHGTVKGPDEALFQIIEVNELQEMDHLQDHEELFEKRKGSVGFVRERLSPITLYHALEACTNRRKVVIPLFECDRKGGFQERVLIDRGNRPKVYERLLGYVGNRVDH